MHSIIQKMLAALVTLALMTGCNSNAGNEYIGTWETDQINGVNIDTKFQFEISRNDENFLVRLTIGPLDPTTRPASYKDGILQASDFALVIDKETGKLIHGRIDKKTGKFLSAGLEYTRVK